MPSQKKALITMRRSVLFSSICLAGFAIGIVLYDQHFSLRVIPLLLWICSPYIPSVLMVLKRKWQDRGLIVHFITLIGGLYGNYEYCQMLITYRSSINNIVYTQIPVVQILLVTVAIICFVFWPHFSAKLRNIKTKPPSEHNHRSSY
jgi:hypothetical protein